MAFDSGVLPREGIQVTLAQGLDGGELEKPVNQLAVQTQKTPSQVLLRCMRWVKG